MEKEISQIGESESLFRKAQQLAEEARDKLKENYGLAQLSNIEFVGLRRIAADMLKRPVNPNWQESLEGEFNVLQETIAKFFHEFYDVRIGDFFSKLNPADDNYLEDSEKEDRNMKEYLRRKQDEMHKL